MNYSYRNITDVFVSRIKELICGNKGAALAITLSFVMPVYLMVIGIYGVGEMVRNKIELQNAADAAAYSAAVVQADYLSRIATVNKAMAWTYVDLQKRSLDLAMALFTVHVFAKFKSDTEMVKMRNSPCHMHAPGLHYNCGTTVAAPKSTLKWAGTGVGIPLVAEKFNGQGALNRTLLVHLGVEAAAEVTGKGVVINGIKVLSRSKAIVSMMAKLNKLKKEYSEKIKSTALQVAVLNMAECKDDYIINIKCNDLPAISLPPTADNEKTFIAWADPEMKDFNPKKVFGPGTDDWIVRKAIPLGFYRVYKQTKNHLYAKWQWFWTRWFHIPSPVPPGGIHMPPFFPGGDYAKGEREYFGYSVPEIIRGMPIGLLVPPALPLTLRPDYFGKAGTISVAIARKSANPFSIFSSWGGRSLTASGLLSAFNPSVAGGSRPEYMCAIATARAGYKRYQKNKKKKLENSSYCIGYTYASKQQSWNLVETDWDAVMIPVRNAWDLCAGAGDVQGFTVAQGNILKEIMLDKKGWVNKKGEKVEEKNLPDWEKLAPPPGLVQDENDKKNKNDKDKQQLDWAKLRDYLGH